MTLLRYVAIVALALWIGGLVALGAIGAPTIFSVLELRDAVHGREIAGLVFGTVFERFQYVALALAAIVGASLGARAAIGPRPRHFKLRLWTLLGLLALGAATAFEIAPRIDAIRTSVNGPVANLPDTDPRRVLFGRLHGASSGVMLLTIVAGLGLLWSEAADQH
jgi:hypothetical protein